MIMQPIRAQSLKLVSTLRANKPLQTVHNPSQTLREAEETFCKVSYIKGVTLQYILYSDLRPWSR